MSLTPDEVRHITLLARVGLDPEEALRGAVARLADQVRAAEAGAAAEDAPDPGDSPDVPVDGS